MKWIKTYKLFESKFDNIKSMIETIRDISIEFEDNNCSCSIFPQDDIKLNIVSLKSRGHLSSISQPFYLEIDIDRRIIVPNYKRSEFGPFPEWFIDNCRRIEDFMKAEGFETKPSVRYGVDWENFDTIDELSEDFTFLPIHKIRLEFIPIMTKKINESVDLSWFDEIFYELIDDGFKVDIKKGRSSVIDFSKVNTLYVDAHDMYRKEGRPDNPITKEVVETVDAVINKNRDYLSKTFRIGEIKEQLLFAESFAREKSLDVMYIYTMKVPNYRYFKSVKDIPDDYIVQSVTMTFNNN